MVRSFPLLLELEESFALIDNGLEAPRRERQHELRSGRPATW